MKRIYLVVMLLLLALLLSLLSLWFHPSATDFVAENTGWNGTSDFYREFDPENISSLEELPYPARQTVLISIPRLEYQEQEVLALAHFVSDGGRLLVLDDYGYGNQLLSGLDVRMRFTNQPLMDSLFRQQASWLPLATVTTDNSNRADTSTVLLNYATALVECDDARKLARSSQASFLDANENGKMDWGEQSGAFTVAALCRLGKGEVIAVADPSILINAMLYRKDNYAFIQYLTNHDSGEYHILFDRSHLESTTLDATKQWLADTRSNCNRAPVLLTVTALLLAVCCHAVSKGGLVG